MDQLDLNLLEAWNRIGAQVRADRLEATRRARRQFTSALQRPPRAWCLCIRASDTRISTWNSIIRPLSRDVSLDDDVSELIEGGKPHILTLSGKTIRELTRPVRIAWPGEDWKIAAAKLGRHPYTIRGWMEHGTLQVRREPARLHGWPGKPRPIVWSPAPIDPNANEGRAPDPIWGTLWQSMWQQLPENYMLKAVRLPPMWARKGRKVQHGWSFICPGRLRRVRNRRGEVVSRREPCGRRVGRLYGPQSIWTLGRALDLQEGFELDSSPVMENLALSGPWFPGVADAIHATGPRCFACKHCWRVRYTSLVDRHGWNHFVTYISGGLLYGHEVPRPAEHQHRARRRRDVKHTAPLATRGREGVLELLRAGLDCKTIAQRRGITLDTVRRHVRALRAAAADGPKPVCRNVDAAAP